MAALVLSCRRSEHTLEQPFVSARGSWAQRTLLALELSGHGYVGRGEASPLPGYSPDDIDACEGALRRLRALDELAACASASAISGWVSARIPAQLPAARFGLETAALDRLGRKLARPVWSLLGDTSPEGSEQKLPLRVAAVLPSEHASAALQAAKRRFEAGVRSFKLKIGPLRLQPTQERTLEALRSELGSTLELRVDANQSLSREELAPTFERLASYAVSFAEEPLARPRPEELAALPCGFALDESLLHASDDKVRSFLELDTCRALVLKPSLLGGLGSCLRLAQLARAYGKAAIASHALEGPVGFAACVQLALALPRACAHGLWPLPHQLQPGVAPPLGLTGLDESVLGAPA